MYDYEQPVWMMNRHQAEAIERQADWKDMTVEELVDHVLDNMSEQFDGSSSSLRKKLLDQLKWILAGRYEDDAPYIREFEFTGVNPFYITSSEMDTSIDRFIQIHIPAAF